MYKHNLTIQAIDASNNRVITVQEAVFTSGECSFTRQETAIEKVTIDGLRGYFFVLNNRDFKNPEKVTADKAALRKAHEKALSDGVIKWNWQNADGETKQVSRKTTTNVSLAELAKIDGVTIDYEFSPETTVDLILSYLPADADAVITYTAARKNAAEKIRWAVERKTADGKLIDRIIVEFTNENGVKNHLKELDNYKTYIGKHSTWLKVPKMYAGGQDGVKSKDAENGETSVIIRKAQDGEKPKAKAKPKATPKATTRRRANAEQKAASNGRRK